MDNLDQECEEAKNHQIHRPLEKDVLNAGDRRIRAFPKPNAEGEKYKGQSEKNCKHDEIDNRPWIAWFRLFELRLRFGKRHCHLISSDPFKAAAISGTMI